MSAATIHRANTSPSRPAASASSALSVTSCETSRRRLAPSAARTPSSLVLALARASRRFATLAHAISSTSATAPASRFSVGRVAPTSCSCSGTTIAPLPSLETGYACSSRAATAVISACARSRPTPFLQPRHDAVVVRAARGGLGLHPAGIPDLAARRKMEVRRHHADDRERARREAHGRAQRVRPAAEAPQPEIVADDCG